MMCLQGTQAAAANAVTSPLDGFEAAVRVARNDASCRIPIVYRYDAPLCTALSPMPIALHTFTWNSTDTCYKGALRMKLLTTS